MSHKTIRRPFIPTETFVARKPILWEGTQFFTGDEFPWKELGCTDRRLEQLYSSGFLTYGVGKKRVKISKEEPDLEEDDETEEQEGEEDSSDEDKAAAKKARREARKAARRG